MIRIVHLSDIHLDKSTLDKANLWVIDQLIKDLGVFHHTKNIDLVFITGDLIDKGGMSFGKTEDALEHFRTSFLLKLQDSFLLTAEQIYFVPGNHDVDRNRDSIICENGLRSTLTSVQAANEFMSKSDLEGTKRIEPFKKFEESFFGTHKLKSLSRYESCFLTEMGSTSVGIVCLNTAWRSYNSETDQGSLIIGERQLQNGIAFTKNAELRIGLLHHPVEWLCDFEQNSVQTMLQKYFQLVFSGHIHKNSQWLQAGIHGSTFVSVGPANWTAAISELNLEYCNGYSIVDVDPFERTVSVHHRRYSASKRAYVANNELGDEHGQRSFHLPTAEQGRQRHDEISLAMYIKATQFEELNERLLTYNIDSHAPKDLRSLFVLPRIVHKEELDPEKKEKEVLLSFDDICNSEQNLFILGSKEAGKTTLLDRLMMEFTDKIEKYRQIPVLLNFEEIGNKRIETIAARFLGLGINAFEALKGEHRFVLLIDDFNLQQQNHIPAKRVHDFLSSNRNWRLIATIDERLAGTVPLEILEDARFNSIQRSFIKSFGTKEIRELMEKWYQSVEIYEKSEKVGRLVQLILSLNLPRTPLAVSMFLWILEQQQNYQPVNQASMLENFVEKLFVKHSRKEIYSDQFDYRNKERILAEIAYYMFSQGQPNYRVRLRALIDLVDDHLRMRKFDFVNSQDVVEHFIEKGLLQREVEDSDTFVRFRFECFFQYFLMKKMDFDPSFKEFVLREENYLYFEDEIDYYTGIRRDQVDILKLLINRMQAEYRDLVQQIQELPAGTDSVFDADASFVKTLDESFVTKLAQLKRPSEAEVEQMKDDALEKIAPAAGIQHKMKELSIRDRMERLWTLAARVLKNTEETTEENVKFDSYKAILTCSLAYAFLWKAYVELYIMYQSEKNPEFSLGVELDFQRKFLPLIHQTVLFYLLGTKKLAAVFREKMVEDLHNLSLSNFEIFVTAFMCADLLEISSFEAHLKKIIRRLKHPHLLDMALLKLVGYYFFRSRTRKTDQLYENLIGDLIIHAKSLPRLKKSKIIQEYRSKKLAQKNKESRTKSRRK